MKRLGRSLLDRVTAGGRMPVADSVGARNLRLVYSRHLEFEGRHEVRPPARLPLAGHGRREDWPSWLTGRALWKLAVLAAALTLLLVVGRRRTG
jgi:hypothetical protein